MHAKKDQLNLENSFLLDCLLNEQDVAHYLIYPDNPDKNYFSKNWKELFGFNPYKVKDVFQEKKNVVLPEFTSALEIVEKAITTITPVSVSYQLQKSKIKSPVWVKETIGETTNPSNGEKIIVGHIRNISEEKNAIAIAEKNEANYRKLFENMELGMLEIDLEEKIVFVNRGFQKTSGYSAEELVGNNASEILLKKKESKKTMQEQHRIRKKGIDSIYELILTAKNGEEKTVIISGAPVYDISGNRRGSVGIHWDITELRKVEKQILQDRINKEKEILEARLQAEEEQRSQIGKDLHDGVGQMLAYIGLYLHVMKAKQEFSLEKMEQLEKSVRNALEQVRVLSRNLAPPAIRDLGLRDAVRDLVASYGIIEKPKFFLKLYPQREDFNLTLEKKIVVFRVIQELLNNTFKYASANNIFINLYFTNDALILDYKDDGVGYDSDLIKNGVGLYSMKSRVEFYNGSMQITTAPKEGCATFVSIPIEK